ncbi:molybdate ABC transporter ATP-binding protein ModF [Reinekea blandensis]|uniref:Putative molybdenum transport ATP-binding protein modF n=1 Tax=Reinekea blandensis MED297 TaxID=314283 RepID=A4B9R8_9GAMM|nr:molybdate ABC transporter ATP-binding protein ModF [Reinekea blandensis]EAR11369.1 putative molybdenum transport ATP-binding protein modF [Reinekea sp. MED297] [Reinekea blandensis MED297]
MQLSDITVSLNGQTVLKSIHWSIEPGTHWLVLGTNASGKSTLARLLSGELGADSGHLDRQQKQVQWLSLETQQALYERELYRDDTDFMDHLDAGTTVRTLLNEITDWSEHSEQVCAQLDLTRLLDRGYRLLSTGEGRRVMLARALLAEPDILILDEPFEGLDRESVANLRSLLQNWQIGATQLILLVNQQDDVIPTFSHLALLHQGEFLYQGTMPDDTNLIWQALQAQLPTTAELPAVPDQYQLSHWHKDDALITLTDGFVQYDDTYQFKGLNWVVKPGQHTQIAGPNGCGKSTLLGLITGDHPQCYRNNLNLLGFQRGQGESIWQIKKHIGYVSGNLHRDYRVGGNVLTAVVSGLTDSIGVYQSVGEVETNLAKTWLRLMGMEAQANRPFRNLSMGEQRLVLIARALIKQPPLLILDEPTQGLDDFNRFYVLSLVEKMIEAGSTTLLFVSHRQDETLACIENRLTFEPSDETAVLFDIVSC